jgi:hypothetical protein
MFTTVLHASEAFENAVQARTQIEKNKDVLKKRIVPYLNYIHQKIRQACKDGLMGVIIQMPRGIGQDEMIALYYLLWQDEGFNMETTYWKAKKFKISWDNTEIPNE